MKHKKRIEESMFAPQIITPGQYFDWRRPSSELDPIKRLMMAMLSDAVRCYRNVDMARTKCERRLFQEAELWLFDERCDGLFSFERVSEELGFDAQFLRRGLREWRWRRQECGLASRLVRRSPVLRRGGRVRPHTRIGKANN